MFSKAKPQPRRTASVRSAATQQFLDMIGFTPDACNTSQTRTRAAYDDPLADHYARRAQHEQDRRSVERAKKARQAPKIKDCADFWRRNLDRVADEHMKALGGIDMFAADVDQQAKELKRRLKIGKRILFQQSDTRWGKEITDLAHEALDMFDFGRFREKITGD